MSIEPVRKQIVVATSPERAFRVFTERMDAWWPRAHHIGKSPLKRMVLESGVGGRWYSICEDGSECGVGKVLEWSPPRRLLLAWQITAQWQFDPAFVTEIEITFTPEQPMRTRVDVEHRNMERFGVAAEALREEFNSPGGWSATLTGFASVAEKEEEQ